ncbi:hypothetical protein GALL_155690 [mine drainage metagenome]|uniref:Uncharacterized protein n=1 Tax=mine drainage metagenome TaxID=410659 RepID=A0A1J5S326_9ZZZZ
MRIQAVLLSLAGAAVIGLALLFTAGVVVSLAVVIPAAIVLALIFGKTEVHRHDSGHF